MAVEIALVSLSFVFLEPNELVRLQILQVAHRQQLSLVGQLGLLGNFVSWRRDRGQEGVGAASLRLHIADLVLKPPQDEVEADI